MMKRTVILILGLLFVQWGMAQAPKWIDKSKKAVFSLITYNKNGEILANTNGFFINEKGIALSDYTSFKGAERAVAIDSDGKQMPVEAILGANSMYDVVKFRVNTSGNKITSLPMATSAPATDATVYLLGYSTQKERQFTMGKVKEVSEIAEGHHYYTLNLKLSEKGEACPILTADGKVFAMAQPASGTDAETMCYALGVSYGEALSVSALGLADFTLKSIGIKKGLPDTEEQALVLLFMASSQVSSEEYLALLEEFIKEYPTSTEGYLRLASYYIFHTTSSMDKAEEAMDKAFSLSEKKDDVHYTFARLINSFNQIEPKETYKDWTMDKAVEEIRKAIAINPLPVYYQTEADIFFAMGNYEGAYNSYQKVMETDLVSPAVFYSAAKAKEFSNAPAEEVIALMDSCIAHCSTPVNPNDAPYLLERASMYMNMEEYRKAMLDYDAYYKAVLGKVNDVFYYYREQASFYGKQFQRALDDINKAIELKPEEPLYHTELGLINVRVGRIDEAIKALNKAIELNQENGAAYRLLGICMVQQKKKKDACKYFDKAKALGDEYVDALIEKHCK